MWFIQVINIEDTVTGDFDQKPVRIAFINIANALGKKEEGHTLLFPLFYSLKRNSVSFCSKVIEHIVCGKSLKSHVGK